MIPVTIPAPASSHQYEYFTVRIGEQSIGSMYASSAVVAAEQAATLCHDFYDPGTRGVWWIHVYVSVDDGPETHVIVSFHGGRAYGLIV